MDHSTGIAALLSLSVYSPLAIWRNTVKKTSAVPSFSRDSPSKSNANFLSVPSGEKNKIKLLVSSCGTRFTRLQRRTEIFESCYNSHRVCGAYDCAECHGYWPRPVVGEDKQHQHTSKEGAEHCKTLSPVTRHDIISC